MMSFRCRACQAGWIVRADPTEDPHVELVLSLQAEEPLICPECHSRETVFGLQGDYRSERELSPVELYRAILGFGLPTEGRCSKADLEELLRGQPVRRLIGRDIPGSSRMAIESIELWDGTRLYLAPSGLHVTVYRVAHPGRATEKVKDV